MVQAPRDFDDRARKLWNGVQRALREQGTFQDSDAGALERYVRALDRAIVARAELAKHGKLTATGSQGQPVPHPLLRVARESERDAHEYAEALLLTPRARRRAGVGETTGMDDELAGLLAE